MPPKTIDPASEMVRQVLADFAAVAARCGARYLLVGGAARDLARGSGVLDARHAPDVRGTADLDFGVLFASDQALSDFQETLADTFSSRARDGQIHFLHRACEIMVDVIPFGAIAPDGRLPVPGRDRHFVVLGFEEALESAAQLEVMEKLWVPIPNSAGFVLLKLMAFGDRAMPHDLQDAVQVMRHYDGEANKQRYFDELVDEFEAGLVYDKARYVLLGLDIGRMASAPSYVRLTEILGGLVRPENQYLSSVVDRRHCLDRPGTTQDVAEEFALLLQGVRKGFARPQGEPWSAPTQRA